MTKMDMYAGDMPSGTPAAFPGTGGPASDCVEIPQGERLQNDLSGPSSRGVKRNKLPENVNGGTKKNKRGKQSNIAYFRNLFLSPGLSQGFVAKHCNIQLI
jgi:hypothetical protein